MLSPELVRSVVRARGPPRSLKFMARTRAKAMAIARDRTRGETRARSMSMARARPMARAMPWVGGLELVVRQLGWD